MLVIWGDNDKLFPISHADRLVEEFPNAALHAVKASSTYVMMDAPGETATAIGDFVLTSGT